MDTISTCQVDLASGTLTLSYRGDEVDLPAVSRAVGATGHSLALRRRRDPAWWGFFLFLFSQTQTALSALAALLTLLGLLLTLLGWEGGTSWILGGAVLVGGFPIVRLAYRELLVAHNLGINTLMVIAVTGAILIGEWAEAAIVVSLFSLGEALEGYAADRARSALDSLLDLAPPAALKLLSDGALQETPIEQLLLGDRVLVRPGDRVSVDGLVRAGRSAVDQSPITGESLPQEKGPGDELFAGTINGAGSLEVEVTRLAADNTLNRMVALVQEAQSRRAPVQRFIDRFARYYTPAVTAAAVLMAALPPLLLDQPFWGQHGWLMRALQILVIACPCALVISTPVTVVSAMTNAASHGVLIKGGRYLDTLSRVRVFALDKTGTLTRGRPVATDLLELCSCGSCPQDCALQHAASLEAQSSHPLARALLAEAQARRLEMLPVQDVVELQGRGLEGLVNGAAVTVASHSHFDQHFPHRPELCRRANQLSAQGKTVVLVQHDGEICGLIGLADTPRENSREVLAALKRQGQHTVMLTGDSQEVAAEIARQVGVDQFLAELLPQDKMRAVADLAARYGPVAMVGDGVNDAPALAQADLGIAMGGAASHQAMETADVVLMGDDLSALPYILALGHKTRRAVTANIALALLVKAAVFGLAAAGLATLWMAIVADVGASLLVILNGMQLRRALARSPLLR